MNPLKSIQDIQRPSPDLVKQAAQYTSADLHEASGQEGALPSGIKPVSPDFFACGPAVTVLSPPEDNLWLHRAIYVAQPGDVLVVETGGYYEAGYWGEIMAHAARERGLAGLVIDGCVRDSRDLKQIGFPIFSRGLSIKGTGKDREAVGGYNQPVRIGDITIFPGDLVVGDADGVVIVQQARLAEVLEKTKARVDKEAGIIQQLKSGARTVDIYGFN